MQITMQADECIIELVRDNKCLYDKRDENYKNTAKKKEVWTAISEKLKYSLGVDMPACNIEKRWTSLRDMFNREHKKQSLPPSGSGYKPSKPWDLYQNLLFLLSHIAHRRTSTSFLPSEDLSFEENISDCSEQDEELIIANSDHDYSNWEDYEDVDALPDVAGKIEMGDVYASTSSASSSNCTTPALSNSLSGTFNSKRKPLQPINTRNQVTKNTYKKLPNAISSKNRRGLLLHHLQRMTALSVRKKFCEPEVDQFVKKQIVKRELLEKELDNATTIISTAVKSMASRASEEKPKEGCIHIIEDSLNKVQPDKKIQCIIELLQDIQKFTNVDAVEQ